MRHPLYWSFSSLSLLLQLATVDPLAATDYAIVTQADDVTANGNCTLREALQAATANAVVDACAAGSALGPDTISLSAGTYALPLGVLDVTTGEEVVLRGPAADPPTAILSGGTTHRILDLHPGSGRLILEDLQLVDGNGLAGPDPLGGAVRAGAASLVARRVHFLANRARRGGALAWYATGSSKSLVLDSCRFESNEALHPDAFDSVAGGAVWLDPTDAASIVVSDSDFTSNRAASALAGDQVVAGAIFLATEGSGAEVRFERLRLLDNAAESTGAGGAARASALSASVWSAAFAMADILISGNDLGASISPGVAAMTLSVNGVAVATLERLRLLGNGLVAGTAQMSLLASGASSVLVLRDSLVAGGVDGLIATGFSGGIVAADHLTVADNSGRGLILSVDGGSLFLGNSVVYDNGIDIDIAEGSPTIRPEMLVGVDPLFVDAAAGDYSLAAGSPAVNVGDGDWEYVGLYDLAHGARVVGPETDLGAYERGALFNDGFEAATTASWTW